MKRTLMLAAFLPLAAHGADWRYMSNNDDWSSIYYAEISGAVVVGPLVSMWMQRVNKTPGTDGVKSEKLRYQFNCKASQIKLLRFVEYGLTGETLKSHAFGKVDWKDVVPDTIGEHWLKFACSGQKQWKNNGTIINPIEASDLFWESQAREAAGDQPPQSNSDTPTPCRFDEYGAAICDQ